MGLVGWELEMEATPWLERSHIDTSSSVWQLTSHKCGPKCQLGTVPSHFLRNWLRTCISGMVEGVDGLCPLVRQRVCIGGLTLVGLVGVTLTAAMVVTHWPIHDLNRPKPEPRCQIPHVLLASRMNDVASKGGLWVAIGP